MIANDPVWSGGFEFRSNEQNFARLPVEINVPMQQTLITIPHAWFEGGLLIAWSVVAVVILVGLIYRHGATSEAWSFIPVALLVAAAIYFVLPQLEVYGIDPEDPSGPLVKQGLLIRGYGVCLVLAIAAGIGIVLTRCRAVGIEPDQIVSLAFWMILSGIAGARVLYVWQKSDQFFQPGARWQDVMARVLDMTEGGLVVYGSLIGGMVAAIVVISINRWSFFKVADLIAPGMMLGLAIGRIGCLMNGCCYGGVCDTEGLPSLQFPAGSPPYMQHVIFGDLLGITTSPVDGDGLRRRVESVAPGSKADQLGLQVDDQVSIYTPDSQQVRFFKRNRELWNSDEVLVLQIDSQRLGPLVVSFDEIADRSLPVHPTQIYSSINALLLALVVWFYWTVRKHDGEVFGLMLILYSIGRFLLEIIRRDEAGFLGTALTISQWVSIATILVGFAVFAYSRIGESVDPTPSENPA